MYEEYFLKSVRETFSTDLSEEWPSDASAKLSETSPKRVPIVKDTGPWALQPHTVRHEYFMFNAVCTPAPGFFLPLLSLSKCNTHEVDFALE